MLQISLDSPPVSGEGLELVYDRDREVADFVGEKLGWIWENGFHAIGLARDGEIVGGVVYSGYLEQPRQVEASIYMKEPRWASRRTLQAFFWYPFVQLGVKKLQTRCKKGREEIREFNERLGFKYEGSCREAWPLGGDAWFFSMLPHECPWIWKGVNNGR